MKNMPEIRFKGFTDAWVQRKLGEVVKVNSGRDYKHLNYGNIPVYGTGGYMLSVDESLSDIDAVGIGRKGTIDKPQLLKAPFWTVDTLFFMTPIQSNELLFLYTVSQSIEWTKLDESTGVPSLSKLNIENVVKYIPNLFEQAAIGNFFHTLDNTILLYKRKLDSLKQLKKAYLQHMFPQEGETVPKVRFAGFTGDWEMRLLGEHTKLITKGTTPEIRSGNGLINFIKVENISNGKISLNSKITKEEHEGFLKRSKLEEGDILISIAGTLGRIAIVKADILPANTNQALAIIRGYDFDSNFLFISLHGNAVADYIRKNPTIGAQPNLSLEQIGKLTIWTPKLKEQTAIGNFFSNIDEQIATQQTKLDNLKKLKSTYLQKMFV